MAGLTGWHLLILVGVMVLLFGAKRLPDMARAVGQSARIFKGEIKGPDHGERTSTTQQPSPLTGERTSTTQQPSPPTGE